MLVVQGQQEALISSSFFQFSTSERVSLVTGFILSLFAMGLGSTGLLGIMALPALVSVGLIILGAIAIIALSWIIRAQRIVTCLNDRSENPANAYP